MPNAPKQIDLSAIPNEIQDRVCEDIRKYGTDMTIQMLDAAPLSAMMQRFVIPNSRYPDIWMQAASHVINYLAPRDPGLPHFTVSREILAEHDLDKESEAVDMLARDLQKECLKLKKTILGPNFTYAREEGLYIADPAEEIDLELVCSNAGMLWLDYTLVVQLSAIGSHSKQESEVIGAACSSRYKAVQEAGFEDMARCWKIWVDTESPLFPPYLQILASCVWEDVTRPKWETLSRRRKSTPAIAQTVWAPSVKEMLSRDKHITQDESGLVVADSSGAIIATATVATADPSILSNVSLGLRDMGTLTGHRAYRFLVRSGFENWVQGADDPRLVQTSGGFAGIADLMGCHKRDDPQRIKRILHAMAHGHFNLPHGASGNLIALEIKKRARNGHPTDIDIVLGTMLLPGYIFNHPANDRKLIPVPDLPPLVANNGSWAAQSMLQLLVLEEFAEKSRSLAKDGAIHISPERWEELASKAQLPDSILEKVLERWLAEDGMLEASDGLYTLNAKRYGNELAFLTEQGNRSESQSKRAQKARQKDSRSKGKSKPK